MRSASLRHCSSVRPWPSLRSGSLFTGCFNVALTRQIGREVRRFHSSGSGSNRGHSSAASGINIPKVPRPQGLEGSATKEAARDDLPPIIDTPAPPRPAFYVPPEKRDPSDESLAFLKPGSPLQHLAQHQVEAPLPGELDRVPFLAAREKAALTYMDADAARVQSTSVHAGQPLLHRRSVVDTSSYYYTSPHEELGKGPSSTAGSVGVSHRCRLHTLQDAAPRSADADYRAPLEHGGGGSTPKERSIFTESHEFAAVDKSVDETEDEMQRAAPKPAVKQLEADIKKLEYYYGTQQYEKQLADFRKKYGEDGNDYSKAAGGRTYTAHEVDRGLDTQPIDYLRSSPKLQVQLVSGLRAYDPVTIMQQQGVMRFQGYAFPPTVELGKLKGDSDHLKVLHDAHKSHPLVVRVRRSFNALIGRTDARDDYVAEGDKPKEDTHLMYRTLGLDAVQRRQMRYMLTDFDHADRHTTFHVMMSYPYTDWLHVFYMVLVGWCLYQLQVRWGAYGFYDEYMGLDLRQAPRLEKPLLAGITVTVMVFLLFQPLLVASVATTRAYRIIMRRPIGPP
ncbi:putative mitochondrial hypothetical protein [Leptomonas pyrrhocoris]|uniref:Transmembrane protein n=1 Tax=Leptomonas pyrrhocoris TaxID=157538 RepID=A0A0M9G1P9_LEPPY|nr:putative mitochondrial hypothetical protein [Leptomonas pyrrhocoris]KPA80443.1 putative mitochondrial hypothetical protein [Leptomonas pyrrhocoris]|eukprot:XP_015658882.1 putative mitochondrial hypothetical protein [Leptomonas pyrrhocoris]